MKNIHLIPTDKPSRLYLGQNNNFVLGIIQNATQSKNEDFTNQHIYITNNETIKEGDWYYSLEIGFSGGVGKCNSNIGLKSWEKIILTTDQDLINDGIQGIDNTFAKWFVKNPDCEYVEINKTIQAFDRQHRKLDFAIEKNDFTKNIYKIIIPKDEPNYNMKQEIEWISNNPQCKQIESCSRSLTKKCICPKDELKTSEEWQKQYPNPKVLDPDGWDRKNYQYHWFEEKITLKEYNKRLYRSTIKNVIPKDELKQQTLEEREPYWDLVDKKAQQNNTIDLDAYAKGVIDGVKWQTDRMFSEDEVLQILKDWSMYKVEMELDKLADELPNILPYEEWFNQFKKK